MARLLDLFVLQLLCGSFTLCLPEIISTDVKSVHPGENITLSCNNSNYSEISWYRLRSEEVKLLISAKKFKFKTDFTLNYNINKAHFDMTVNSSSASLMIIGVNETDLGFYYCGGQINMTYTEFGKPIRLNFTDNQHHETSSKPPDPQQCKEADIWMILCVVSVVINVIFIFILICMLFCMFKGKSAPYTCCCNTTDTAEKDENIHYSSIQHKRRSGTAAKKNTASDSDRVTYATVNSKRH